MSVSQNIPDNIKRAARSVGYALWLDSEDEWCGLPVILRARLDERQRAALAFMALKSLDRDKAMQTAEAALHTGAGSPQAPLFGVMDQAAFWADMAEPEELEAYCLASFNAMQRPRQAAFLDFVRGRAVA
ncbi:hypothetical protein [Celeribacter halophilus]|uniref:hypothetical protein n=1 Tax=Celeribacter halophilus TaxID=576117 RepID=UPI002FD20C74